MQDDAVAAFQRRRLSEVGVYLLIGGAFGLLVGLVLF